MTKNEIKAIIAKFDANVNNKFDSEYSEILSKGIGLFNEDDEIPENIPEDEVTYGGVFYYFDNGEVKLIVDTYSCYPPEFTEKEFIDAYAE